ncbi:MAG: lamin tail domain-containing protein [Nanoarchaeota archaeon]|nr:lamin tail domain-containing protein [Nanoarchaeota archaeon]MBU4308705.1 lamin tail domain-containing protein [Nanoarchaeota archaeon]
MNKKVVFLIIVFSICFVSALRINEFELNPEGDDSGNEWVELYHWDKIDLTGYKLVNGDGGEIELSGSFEEYFVYTFEKQWLDNKDEQIFLYKGEELIDETPIDYDSQNDARTLQYCKGEWIFEENTKGEENLCEEPEKEKEKETEKILDFETSKNVVEKQETEISTINLNPKDIKIENDSEILDKDKYSKYGIGFFCVLICFLFLLKKRNKKNEFR